jgi:predicted amidohydrolase YtcJ
MANPYSTAYVNGQIITMDVKDSIHEAVLVVAGVIRAVGSTAQIMEIACADTRIIDLHGKVMLPGFIDAHSHFPMSGMQALYRVDLNSPPIGTVRTLEELLGKLKAKAATTPKGEWVVGVGYDDTLLPERKHPTRFELDQVTDEHPVLVRHISGHVGVVNSYALKKVSIDKDTPQPPGGVIGKTPVTGEPNGFLAEEAIIPLFYSKMFALTLEQDIRSIEHAACEYASAGLTTVQMGALRDGTLLNALVDAVQTRKMRNRLVVWAPPSFIDQVSRGSVTVEGWKRVESN